MRLSLPWDTIIKALPKTTLPLINIGFGEDLTIGELAEAIADAAGFTGAIEWDRTKPVGTSRKFLDRLQMRGLGWKPNTTSENGLRLIAFEIR